MTNVTDALSGNVTTVLVSNTEPGAILVSVLAFTVEVESDFDGYVVKCGGAVEELACSVNIRGI